MTCDSRKFFQLFFEELEKRGIPSVILHSYQEMPEQITSDIDYAVPAEHLPRLCGIQAELARKNGWALVQTLQHGVFAFYAVLVNLQEPGEILKLDACANYARARRFLVPEKVLLANRRPCGGFYIPAPAAEFIYVLAKVFDTKKKNPAKYLPRLKELWLRDPATAQVYFTNLFGETGRTLEQWFQSPAEEWSGLGALMLARNRFGPALLARESLRVLKRLRQPTGLCLAVLGSDGAGKSTLLAHLKTMLEPCFRQQRQLHFRPQIFRKRTQDDLAAIATPHARKPKNLVASWLRVIYYFLDFWAGWLLLIFPARIRSTLVIFDRDFDDLLVDERRYRLQGTRPLVRLLRHLLPRPQRTFLLSGPTELLRQRKPELPPEELDRQQLALRALAQDTRRYLLVSVEQSPEEVARTVWRDVMLDMAAREENRI